jgi:hypothetical protein
MDNDRNVSGLPVSQPNNSSYIERTGTRFRTKRAQTKLTLIFLVLSDDETLSISGQ